MHFSRHRWASVEEYSSWIFFHVINYRLNTWFSKACPRLLSMYIYNIVLVVWNICCHSKRSISTENPLWWPCLGRRGFCPLPLPLALGLSLWRLLIEQVGVMYAMSKQNLQEPWQGSTNGVLFSPQPTASQVEPASSSWILEGKDVEQSCLTQTWIWTKSLLFKLLGLWWSSLTAEHLAESCLIQNIAKRLQLCCYDKLLDYVHFLQFKNCGF